MKAMDDMVDDQQLINWAVGVVGTAIAYVYKTLHDRMKDVERDSDQIKERISANEVLMVSNFVKNDRFENLERALFAKLDRIEDKLDRKEDKHG